MGVFVGADDPSNCTGKDCGNDYYEDERRFKEVDVKV